MAQSIVLGDSTFLSAKGISIYDTAMTLEDHINAYAESGRQYKQIGTTWTDTSTSVTIPSDGWYLIYASLEYSSSSPRGVAIVLKSTANTIYAKTEYDGSTFGTATVGAIMATAFVYLSKNTVLTVFAKSASQANQNHQITCKRVL